MPPTIGIGDPASLLPLSGLSPLRDDRHIGFMPHFESAIRVRLAGRRGHRRGVTSGRPTRDNPARGHRAAIGKECRVIISEALHGVIVADALRVPWIAIRPLAPIHRPKWIDWAETLDLEVAFHQLPPSTLLERAHLTHLSRLHTGRNVLHPAGLSGCVSISAGAVCRPGSPEVARDRRHGAAIVSRFAAGGSPGPDDGSDRLAPPATHGAILDGDWPPDRSVTA